MTLSSCLLVALGGALGSLARHLLSVLAQPVSRDLPWGTILINVGGSFVIGFFGTLTAGKSAEGARLFVMTGLCGGFTTFSAFSLQTFDLLRAGAPGRALANVLLSVVLCVGAVAAGHALAGGLGGGAEEP